MPHRDTANPTPAPSSFGQVSQQYEIEILAEARRAIADQADALDDGEHVEFGKSFCSSAENGVTCESGRHGFFVSAQEVKLF